MATSIHGKDYLSLAAYSNCKTRVIDLQPLAIPESGSDDVYRQVYQDYTKVVVPGSNRDLLRRAVESIKYGIAPPVAFPTETVYGLGADATNTSSVAGIFAAKGRPNDNPLIVHVSSSEHLQRVIGEPLPAHYNLAIERFWPGPMTILLPVPANSRFAPNVHPEQNTIGFRMPSSKYARFFIAACDRAIAGPSANSSGKPSPTTAQHVLDDLSGKINFILDGGNCDVGVESTVVDGLHDPPLILRPGGVSLEELRQIGGIWAETAIAYNLHHSPSSPSTPASDLYVENTNGAPRAPGMKYRHYSPAGKLVLFSHAALQGGKAEEYLSTLVKSQQFDGKAKRIGFISWSSPKFLGVPSTSDSEIPQLDTEVVEQSHYVDSISVASYGKETESQALLVDVAIRPTIADLAKELFGVLRLFDNLKCDYIFAELVQRRDGLPAASGQVWDAVADRLGKAASETIEE
ncbi:hypothetical protein DV736_g1231, partial [Chaetothyriales sp. CBS 134916]